MPTTARLGLVLVVALTAGCEGRAKPDMSGVAPRPTSASSSARAGSSVAPPAPSERASVGTPAPEALARLGEPVGACDWVAIVSSCTEAVGTNDGEREAAFRALAGLCKSIPRRGACPAADRVGSCRTLDGFVDHYYAAGARPYTLEEAKAECENRDGRWLG